MSELPDLWREEKRENYYVSITDMLIGLLFLFIIMLMYFALQLSTTTQDLVTSDQTRSELLNKVRRTCVRETYRRKSIYQRACCASLTRFFSTKAVMNPKPKVSPHSRS